MEYRYHKKPYTLPIGHVHMTLIGDGGYSVMEFPIEYLRLIYRAMVNNAWNASESTFKASMELADGIERMLHDCGFHVFEDEKEED